MNDTHQHVTELIPWYVNGTLTRQEHTVVDEHVRECLPCRRALKDEESVRGILQQARVPTPHREGLDRLLEQIQPQQRPRHSRSRSGAWLALAACAASVAIIYSGVANRPVDVDPAFRTLTSAQQPGAAQVDVVFSASADRLDIEQFLTDRNARIMAGPSAIGRYTLALPPGEDMQAEVASMRTDARIRFAGPSFIDTAESPEYRNASALETRGSR